MTVGKFISIIEGEVKKCDRDVAPLLFYVGDQRYSVESMSGFGYCADVVVELKPVDEEIEELVLKKAHLPALKKTAKKIIKDIKKCTRAK